MTPKYKTPDRMTWYGGVFVNHIDGLDVYRSTSEGNNLYGFADSRDGWWFSLDELTDEFDGEQMLRGAHRNQILSNTTPEHINALAPYCLAYHALIS